ncbi:uncharacterized protein [Gossypium hirsutum]|uniref:DNA/RNA polymerases superfamily protein n=1 Tax=Gossypium hirsutum TaxID=3635 RepID=A0A1U8NJ26_GOSHI|nr:uncharacterized protein LOC107947884 [Gossypium hirsutum]
MFFIRHVPYTALVDVGSTYSYIACIVSKTLGVMCENTTSEVTVLSPLGQSVRINKLYKEVPLEVQGRIFLADLMELPFGEFDLILGMDWLVKHQANLDCATTQVVLKTAEGYKAYLAYIGASSSNSLSVKDIRTVKDFLDVFPDKLSGLPPNREVEFGIELLPCIAPVPIAPYRMAPEELVELKAHIQELLDRGRYRSAPAHIVSNEEVEVRPDLTFEEEPIQILDRDVKVLRRNSVPLVKVLWHNHSSEEGTWEPEAMR